MIENLLQVPQLHVLSFSYRENPPILTFLAETVAEESGCPPNFLFFFDKQAESSSGLEQSIKIHHQGSFWYHRTFSSTLCLMSWRDSNGHFRHSDMTRVLDWKPPCAWQRLWRQLSPAPWSDRSVRPANPTVRKSPPTRGVPVLPRNPKVWGTFSVSLAKSASAAAAARRNRCDGNQVGCRISYLSRLTKTIWLT